MPTSDNASTKDIKWTDAQIRWPDDHKKKDDNDNDNEHETNDDDENDDSDDGFHNPFDPFADPDPTQVFPFRFEVPGGESSGVNSEGIIDLRIHGYKTSSDEVWQSTGLTLWKASKYLCDYMVSHAVELRNKRVLELGAGLGLNGLLAHRLGARSVVITDGDSDAMVALRENIAVNQRRRPPPNNNNNNNNNKDHDDDDYAEEEDGPTRCWDVSAAQLLWGRDHSESFLEKIANGSKFDTIIASDIVYSPLVIDPLWETVRVLLLRRSAAAGGGGGSDAHDTRAEFWMAFAIRKVPVTIDFVLEKAREYGFDHELVDEQLDGHDYGDDNIEGDPETGKVYIYRFWWSESGIGAEEPSITDR